MRYIDLFSGIGGFALGLRQAGIEFEEHWFSEIDKNAISIYKKHFPNAKELGDVRTIRDFSGLKADIITFGFPCQDLSVAGKRRGLAGDRSGLFFEAMRIIRELKPQYFIFENVKGLLTNNGGADFVGCLQEIADIGLYECEWQLVNTSWVLPQNRERVYFVGRLRGQSGAKIFPLFSGGEKADGLQGQYTNTITSEGYTKVRQASYVIESQQFHKVRQINRSEKNRQQDRHGIYDGARIRKLTPVECERLQGFPDGWTEYGADGKKMSDSARYRALGNAVTVDFPRMIGEKLR